MGLQSNIHELRTLVQSRHPLLCVETSEEQRLLSCADSVAMQLKMPLYHWSITQGLKNFRDFEALPKTQSPIELLTSLERISGEGIFVLKDFAPELEDRSVSRKIKEICYEFEKSRSTLIICGSSIELPKSLRTQSLYFKLSFPSTKELASVVKNVVQSLSASQKLKIEINQKDLDQLLVSLKGLSLNQARQFVTQAILEEGALNQEVLDRVLKAKVRAISDGGLLEFFPAFDNTPQLGGFERLREWLDRAELGFSDEAKKLGLKAPKGILLLGIPGCGKSLSAKYCARIWELPLLKLDFGRLYDKYIGETEKNFFRSIEKAEQLAPVVLWLDEIEKAIQTQSGSEDGGLGQRLLGSFLSWLQEKRDDVFVVATANDIRSLPPELMRKGRFDEIFFVDLPNLKERLDIIKIHLSLRKQPIEKFDLEKLATACHGFTGAEIEQAIVASLYESLHQKVILDTKLVLTEIQATKPLSVTRAEEIEELREFAGERFVPVS